MKKIVSLLALSIAFTATAAAQKVDTSNYWSQSASACAPTDANIQADAYLITGGTIKHKGSSTAQINVMCGVEKNNGATAPNALLASFQDYDGAVTTFQVVATLWSRNRTTGSLSSIVTVNSNLAATSGQTQWGNSFSHSMNFESNAYYVYASVLRGSTGNTPYLSGVSLGNCSNC